MDKFTKEEISLCKQVAGKHRKKIEYGDWFYKTTLNEYEVWIQDSESGQINSFPLWTISDCLEFLRGREIYIAINHLFEEGSWRVQLWKKELQAFYSDYSCEDRTENKTPLEACLRAVLAVLEEKDKSNGSKNVALGKTALSGSPEHDACHSFLGKKEAKK